jgi:hypothetical protein
LLPPTFRCAANHAAHSESSTISLTTFVTEGDVYQARRRDKRGGNFGARITSSRERIRAELAGVNADETKIGMPGDILVGAKAIANYYNELIGHRPAPIQS